MSYQSEEPEETAFTTDTKMAVNTKLLDGLAQLFGSGDYSDLTVRCEGNQWQVHRAVLCSHSTFFANACKDGFQEGISHVIELKEDDPTLLRETLKACYTGRYDDCFGGNNKLAFNARMYAMADKYDISVLRDLSKGMFTARLNSPFNILHFLDAVQIVYTSTLNSDRGLRDLLVPVLKKQRALLNKSDMFLDLVKSGFANGDFTADVIGALSQLVEVAPEPRYYYKTCDGEIKASIDNLHCDASDW